MKTITINENEFVQYQEYKKLREDKKFNNLFELLKDDEVFNKLYYFLQTIDNKVETSQSEKWKKLEFLLSQNRVQLNKDFKFNREEIYDR